MPGTKWWMWRPPIADVAERPPAVADPPGREPDDGERAEEAGEQVEEDGFAPRRAFVAADRDPDRVEGRRRGHFDEQAFVFGGVVGAPAQHATELAGHHRPGPDQRHPGERHRRPLRLRPAEPRARPSASSDAGR